MEEEQAARYYDDQKARGSGAQRFKHGLGFGGCVLRADGAGPLRAHACSACRVISHSVLL